MFTENSRFGVTAARVVCVSTVLVGATHADVADAQTKAELAKARRAFQQGISLEAAGEWSGALAKFEAVAKVKLTPQVRFHMARCKEHLGRLNEALGDYRVAEYEASQAGAKELAEIRDAKEKLEARVPKLVIIRGEGAERATLELDGVELGEARIGQEVSVDPGPHTVVARLPGGGRFEEPVTLNEGETKRVEMIAPEGLVAKPGGVSGDEPEPDVPPDDSPAMKVEPDGSSLPWIIGGVGAASLVASGVFFALKGGAESDLEGECRGDVCPRSLEDTQSKGESYAMLSGVTFGVGVVGVGVAVAMLLSGGSSEPAADAQASSRMKLNIGTHHSFRGVNLVGRF